jgi:hypothetical protein
MAMVPMVPHVDIWGEHQSAKIRKIKRTELTAAQAPQVA